MDIFVRMKELAEAGKTADIITMVSAPDQAAGCVGQMLLGEDGNWQGELVDAAFAQLVGQQIQNIDWKKPMILELTYKGGQYRLFWDKLSRRRSALVLGAGHISQPLCMLLSQIGYAVTVVDDRPDFANTMRFPQAEQVVCKNFGQALAELRLAGYGAIIVVTRGHRSDMECLQAVIDQPANYIGMIGSQGRVRLVMNSLRETGVNPDTVARLRAPIGLDIGAETPVEIALSIVAEIVAVNTGSGCRPLSDKWRCK
ncbi:MAG: xanthine dehydrogenase accessory protein XdhC [Firmicutes bacterium]|nr:xanthine dehydrogenase accessory protein XdhC [Bacillota bacterium]